MPPCRACANALETLGIPVRKVRDRSSARRGSTRVDVERRRGTSAWEATAEVVGLYVQLRLAGQEDEDFEREIFGPADEFAAQLVELRRDGLRRHMV